MAADLQGKERMVLILEIRFITLCEQDMGMISFHHF